MMVDGVIPSTLSETHFIWDDLKLILTDTQFIVGSMMVMMILLGR